jgi:hypothetical protein
VNFSPFDWSDVSARCATPDGDDGVLLLEGSDPGWAGLDRGSLSLQSGPLRRSCDLTGAEARELRSRGDSIEHGLAEVAAHPTPRGQRRWADPRGNALSERCPDDEGVGLLDGLLADAS